VAPGAPTDDRGRSGRRSLLTGSTLVALGLAVGQTLGYVLSVAGARLLGPSGYGELSALLGLLLIGNVVALAVQTVASRRTSVGVDSPAALDPLGLRFGAVEAGAALLVAPVIAAVLHLDVVAVAAVALVLLPVTASGVALGVVQGARRFAPLAAQYAVLTGVRTGLALLALLVRHDVRAAALGMLVGSVVAWWVVTGLGGVGRLTAVAPSRAMSRETLHVAHALLAMFTFTSFDVLLARALQPAEQAGQYAAGAILVKIAFWLPQAVVVAAFPQMSAREPGALPRAARLVASLGVLMVLGAVLLGPAVVPPVLGEGYDVAANHAWLFVLVGVLESLAYLVVFDRLASRDRNAVWLVWGAVALVAVLAAGIGRGPVALAWVLVLASVLLCAAGVVVPRRADTDQAPVDV